MKKATYMFLLILPLIILGVISAYSSVIARFIPIAVESISFTETEIYAQPGESAQLTVNFMPERASNKKVTYFSSDNEVVTVSESGTLSFVNYGFAEITAISDDGKYETTCDILLSDENDDPSVVKTVVFTYKNELHSDYRFGNGNAIKVGYKFYPKTAVSNIDFTVDGGSVVKNNDNSIILSFEGTGKKTLSASVNGLKLDNSYDFNVYNGENLTSRIDFATFTGWLNAKKDVFILEDYFINSPIFFEGCAIFGNNKKIDHSGLPHYDDTSLNASVRAISLSSGGVLDSVRVVGKVKDNRLLYERVVNVGMTGDNVTIKNCIIQNGKYNICTYGSNVKFNSSQGLNVGSKMYVENTDMIGASWASVQINNAEEIGYKKCSTELYVKDVFFDLTNVGFLLENSQSSAENGTKGFSRLTVMPSDKEGSASIISNNWRNVDEGYSESGISGYEYLLDEIKSDYPDIVYKDSYNDYYVNCVILVMGGWRNLSTVTFLDQNCTTSTLGYFERTPSIIEAQQLGGKEKFSGYCVKSAFYA